MRGRARRRYGSRTEDSLVIDVDDSGPCEETPTADLGSGLGLTGMRERVALYGGTLDVGPTPRRLRRTRQPPTTGGAP